AGEFPDKLEDIQSLPGIGQSTAGAIASIALKQRAPILDGNVKRVLARFAAIEGWTGEKSVSNQLWKLADELTPHQRVDEYTQAIMDLGASLCSRRNPDCGQCPMQSACKAFAQGRQNELPTPKPKSKNPVKEAWILAIRDSKGRLLFQKRPPTGIWGGLWSLPQVERDLNIAQLPDYIASQLGLQGQYKAEATPFEHQFSHFKLVLHPILFECENTVSEAVGEYSLEGKEVHKIQEGFTDSQFYSRAQWREIGLPAPIKKLLSSDSLPIKEQIELGITEDI
ncbi:MAG: NUDIX domain-containing protein, partial [Pseudomonadales bacterium]|nr:NUDIX domain-containing protein [Pseudomonadales bacterium]